MIRSLLLESISKFQIGGVMVHGGFQLGEEDPPSEKLAIEGLFVWADTPLNLTLTLT